MNTQTIQIDTQHFTMHPLGVLFWEERSMLLISDVHLGKVSHFRKFGAAVPQKAIQRNFELLDEVVGFFNPRTVVFMGDLFHSSLNKEWQLFADWSSRVTATLVLVIGNHDIISPDHYENLGIQVVSELRESIFLLSHHPEAREGYFNFCGHIHPAIRLSGMGRQSVRLRCFFKSESQMILPAFGEFTGSHTLEPEVNCEVFALLGDTVLPVPIKAVRSRNRRFSK